MPHFVIEYSQDVARTHDINALCQHVFDTARDTEIFDAPTIKVRARPCPYWRTGTEPESFAHVTIRLMPGRENATKSDLTDRILTALDRQLPDVGSLTVDLKEINPSSYAKRVL